MPSSSAAAYQAGHNPSLSGGSGLARGIPDGAGIRLVTLCGSSANKSDAVRDAQDIIEAKFAERGLTVLPVDLGSWAFSQVPPILREIKRQRPDVILMQYPTEAFGWSLSPMAISALQRVAPLVIMLHEFVAGHPLRKLAVGALAARANLIATAADREAQSLSKWYPWISGRLRRVPIASNIPGRAWSPARPQKVVYFGQIRPEKGLEDFLECQAKIRVSAPQVEFEIIGATVTKFADFARTTMTKASARGIRVLHGLETDQVADALATATVALLPFPEGASLRRGSLFAAAACGVPLATKVGLDTPAEMVPYLEVATNNQDLTALTLRLLNDEESRVRAHHASQRLSGRFGWETAVDCYLEVFQEAVNSRRPPSLRRSQGGGPL